MKATTRSAAFLASLNLATTVLASSGTVHFNIWKPSGSLQRRATSGTVNSPIYNEQGSEYLVNFTLGTPPQSLSVQLDTGSADLWVISTGSVICQDGVSCTTGTYSQNSSSTSKTISTNTFQDAYGDNTYVNGNYVSDTLTIDGTTLKGVEFGLAITGDSLGEGFQGIMGVAYDTLEDQAVSGGSPYPNIIDVLVSQGAIGSKTYSLWLDDLEAAEGTILFGGINTAKYTGSLSILPVLQSQTQNGGSVYSYLNVALAGVGYQSSSSSSPKALSFGAVQPALLDSGTTLTFVPKSTMQGLVSALGLTTVQGIYVIPCSTANNGGSVTFTFGSTSGPVISVPLSELNIGQVTTTQCQFGIQVADSNGLILGDTFLRSAYVLYNLQDNVIGIAQTNTNPGSDNIIALSAASGSTISIPSATQAATGSVSQGTAPTGAGIGPNQPTNSAQLASQSAATTMTSQSGKSAASSVKGQNVRIGAWFSITLVLGGALLGGGMLVL